jgi:hypothetical protein
MAQQILADSFVGYSEKLAIFEKPVSNFGVDKCRCVTYFPVNDYSTQGIIQFIVPNNGTSYTDLQKTMLNVRCKVVNADGTDVKDSTANEGIVGVVNSFMHAIWSRVDVSLQNKMLTRSDEAYPYQAHFKNLLFTSKEAKTGSMQAQMYYADDFQKDEEINWVLTDNNGFEKRSKFFKKSREVEMSGPILADVLEISRLIPYGVPLSIILYPSQPQFCLMSPDTEQKGYKVVITRISLSVCTVDLAPEILLAHAEIMEKTPAIFPYTKSEIRKFTLPKGVFMGELDDPFQGRIPSEIIIGIVKDSANYGDYKCNPFYFQNAGLNFINVLVDGQEMGQGAINTKFGDTAEDSHYIAAYQTLNGVDGSDCNNPISRLSYPFGACLYRFYEEFNQGKPDDDVISMKRLGNMRITLKFDKQLDEAKTVLVFGKFPAAIKIDKTRAVYEV